MTLRTRFGYLRLLLRSRRIRERAGRADLAWFDGFMARRNGEPPVAEAKP